MASPFDYIHRFLTEATRYRKLAGHRKRRRLLMESLEHRNLLAIDSLAAITGTVYLDGAVDTPVESAMVDLYLDGGDGVLDRGAAGGDDTSMGSATTDAVGIYRFDDLQAGLYFVEQQPISGALQHPSDSVQTVSISSVDAQGQLGLTIDSFDQTTQLVEAPDDMLPSASAEDVQSGEAVGGERDLVVQRDSASGRVRLAANDLSSGFLELTTSSGTLGLGTATWDGDDNDSAVLDATGLSGIDLTASGANSAFRMAVGADHPSVMLTLRVYTDADNWSSATFEVTNTGSAIPDTGDPTLVAFDALVAQDGAGADLTNVGAIEVEIQGVVDVQVGFDDLGMIGPTVFPVSFANFEPLSLGDLVWNDANNNGTQDAGESGIENVVVNLFADTDGSGDLTAGDAPQGTETTDGNGNFQFQNLFSGDFILQVDPSNFAGLGALSAHVSSNGSGPATDPDDDPSNSDDNGDPSTGQGVVSRAVTLLAGTEPTDDGDADANTNLSVDFGFTPVSDLSIVKSDAPDPVVAGEELTYTLLVTNNGPADDTGVVATDTLPPGVVFKSAAVVERPAITPENTAGVITTQVGHLASGESVTVLIVVTVDSAVTQLLQNTASVTGDNYDIDLANNTSGADTDVETLIDLEIAKEASEDLVHVGDNLVYTLVVTNNGPSDATGVTVSDPLPAGVTLVSHSSSQGTITESGGVITADVGALASGALATIFITVNVGVDASAQLENTATVAGSGAEPEQELGNNSATTTTEVKPLIDLAIDKTVDLSEIDPGGRLVYTLLVTNNGPSDATVVTVTDQLPSGVTYVSAVPDQGSASESGGVVTVNLGDLAAGEDAQVLVTVDVDLTTVGTLTNSSSVTGFEDEVTTANNTDTAVSEINPLIDLVIEKFGDPDIVDVGGELTYTLQVSNDGPSDATNVVVVDNLPDGVSFKSATSTVGAATESNGVVTVDMGDMASGEGATVTIVVDVDLDAVGTLANTAVVSGNEDETNENNNEATATTTISPRVDLAIIKADSPDPVTAGRQLTYTLSIENNGPSDATGVEVVDTLPAGVTYASGSSTVGSVSHANGIVTVDIGGMVKDATVVVTIVVDVAPSVRDSITNTAEVSSNEVDINAGNNIDNEPTTVQGRVDLAVTKTDSVDPVTAGEELTYTLTVTNNGPSDATDVELTDSLPDEVQFVSGNATQGSVSHSAGSVTAALGNLDVGESQTITIVVEVDSEAFGTISNTAEVTSTEEELNSADNTATEPTAVDELLSSLAGYVYIDLDNDGQMDEGEPPIPGVTIQLIGTGPEGEAVNLQAVTDDNGAYLFENLRRGTYALTEGQPNRYLDGLDTLGSVSATTDENDAFTALDLPPGVEAVDYLFGERAPTFSKRRFLSSR